MLIDRCSPTARGKAHHTGAVAGKLRALWPNDRFAGRSRFRDKPNSSGKAQHMLREALHGLPATAPLASHQGPPPPPPRSSQRGSDPLGCIHVDDIAQQPCAALHRRAPAHAFAVLAAALPKLLHLPKLPVLPTPMAAPSIRPHIIQHGPHHRQVPIVRRRASVHVRLAHADSKRCLPLPMHERQQAAEAHFPYPSHMYPKQAPKRASPSCPYSAS